MKSPSTRVWLVASPTLQEANQCTENRRMRISGRMDKEVLSEEGTMITWKDVATDMGEFNSKRGRFSH